MEAAQIPFDEQERLNELYRYNILDTPVEEDFNEMVFLASQFCKTPVSTISFIDKSRQWAKALIGTDTVVEDRNASFCAHTILNDDLFEVKNALHDERFSDNPLVKQKPKIRFYAGMPLITSSGHKLGALCVIDTIPRKLSPQQTFALKVLSKQTVKLLELRLLNKQMSQTTEAQKHIISVMSHDVRSPLNSIKSVLDLNNEKQLSAEEKDEMLDALSVSVNRTLQLLDNLVEWSKVQLQAKHKTEVLNLKNIADESIEQAELNATLKHNKIINMIDAGIFAEADKEGIQFIIRNLISNANKFTQNGTIKVELTTKDKKVFLCVEDNGVGIEMSRIKQVLEPTLNHTSNGTNGEKGSGLGLSLIKSYLTKSGNDIEIKSIVNQGTSVSFSVCTVAKTNLISVFA